MKIDISNVDDRQIHDLLGRVIVPRPVAFISTVGEDDIYNAAPYSLVIPVS